MRNFGLGTTDLHPAFPDCVPKDTSRPVRPWSQTSFRAERLRAISGFRYKAR